MNPFATSLLACVAAGSLAIQSAPAWGASGSTARVSSVKVTQDKDPLMDDFGQSPQQRGSSRGNRQPASQDTGATQRSHLAEMRLTHRELEEQRKADAHEKAEADARANRIYAASQVSAPIITDAKACRRVGANGESIYENCLTPADNAAQW